MTLITQKGEKYGDAVLVINSRVHLSNAPVWKKKKKRSLGTSLCLVQILAEYMVGWFSSLGFSFMETHFGSTT